MITAWTSAAERHAPTRFMGYYRMRKLTGKNPRLKKNTGFTLLEVMIALSVIAIVLVSIYRLHAQTIDLSSMSRFYSTAPLLAQRKLAELNILSTLSSDAGDFADTFPGYRWQVTISDVESNLLGTTAQTLKRIDLRVTLNEAEYIYDLRTYRNFWD